MSLEICNIVVNKLHQLGDAPVIEDTYTDSLLKFCQYCEIFPNILKFEGKNSVLLLNVIPSHGVNFWVRCASGNVFLQISECLENFYNIGKISKESQYRYLIPQLVELVQYHVADL